ncbi:NADPH-dependent FMN reductase [Lactobacillus sp.]|uniref:NADPH-dependent FMN reductase n=1 Tax=Lactobacillus sp. TaxID=1591 RepID=UPI003EF4BED9
MKVLALNGSNADKSYNGMLLKYIAKHFASKYDFEYASVKGLPMFKEGEEDPEPVAKLNDQVEAADLVLIASPEQQHSVSSALKSALEWLSTNTHPFNGKPVVIVSTSPLAQGAARSQTKLKTILASPGLHPIVFNDDEFMMGGAPSDFDENGDLKVEGTVKFLDHFFDEVDAWYAQVTK